LHPDLQQLQIILVADVMVVRRWTTLVVSG
jgi:hypothetical protein